ncbi:MAG: M3 family oligoendopeptidase [Firmicutes bacterium]|nr:M3 family oligoendopeptidase [Bacillota bacterium]
MKFSEMPYERPDVEGLKKEITEFTESLKNADTYEEARDIFVRKDQLDRHVKTLSTLTYIRHSIDTRDEFYDSEMNFWNAAGPELMEYDEQWTRTLLDSKFRNELEAEFGEVIFLNAELELKAFKPEIIPLLQKENDLVTEYDKLIANSKFPFRGETSTVTKIGKYKTDADDDIRLEAWKADGKWYRDNKEKLDSIYDQLVHLRDEMGKKLGFEDFTGLGYCRMVRNCYDKNDVEKFRSAVVKYLVPIADSIYRKQAERLGKEYPMSFADNALMFRSGNPRPQGTSDEIIQAAKRFYDGLSPETGEFFRSMLECETMDLLAKEGKEGGGYCDGLTDYEMPFIFANFNGTSGDVETMTHEAGHAFAAWYNRKRIPLNTIWPSLEACEVHSMSMEFFGWKSAEDFFGPDARKFLYSHLATSVTFIPYGTMVDHFQHIVYEHPEYTPDQRHAEWKRLLGIYMPWMKLDGEIPFYSEGMGWQRQSHIYDVPFYYIDYCLAQTVALEFWAMIQDDYDNAWKHYMAYTEQGGSETFTKLLEKAGMDSPFNEEILRGVCEKAGKWLDDFDLTGIE